MTPLDLLQIPAKVVSWAVPGVLGRILDYYRTLLTPYKGQLIGTPPALVYASGGRRDLAARVGEASSLLDQTRGEVKQIWRGKAWGASDAAIGRLDPKLDSVAATLRKQATVLECAADGLQSAAARIAQVFSRFEAGARHLLEAARNFRSPVLGMPVEIGGLVRQAIALGRISLAEAENVKLGLGKLYHDLAVSLVADGVNLGPIPEPGTYPKQVLNWWNDLTSAQQQAYLALYPQIIGGLDGIPAVHRDTANRELLRRYLDTPRHVQDDPRYQAVQNLYDRLKDRQGQLLLLKFDPQGDGRAIVAVGNPDTAQHIGVMVPGVFSTLGNFPPLIDRAQDVVDAAANLGTGNGNVSVIAWLDYDPPGRIDHLGAADLGSAGWDSRAKESAAALHSSLDGLLATSQTVAKPHLSLFGHSYGTVTIGAAARVGRLPVDDILLAGSPGVGVGHASQLGDPGHIWVGAFPDDRIANVNATLPHPDGDHPRLPTGAPTVITLATAMATGPLAPVVVLAASPAVADDAYHYLDERHNLSPHRPEFGANVLKVGQSQTKDEFFGPHSDYWIPGKESLNAHAKILVGQYPRDEDLISKAP